MKNYLAHTTDDLFDQALNSFFRPFYVEAETSFMKTDITESETDYSLAIEMPGFDKKDISLKFEKGYLTVSAKREASTEKTRYIRRERATSCSRSYYMGDVDEKLIKAKHENGILTITVPKQKPQDARHTILID